MSDWPGEREARDKLNAAINTSLNALQRMVHEAEALRAENERLREALGVIVDSYTARSELFTSDAECAVNLNDHAIRALKT